MSINWLTYSEFVPTYGNYGGPSFSGGAVLQPGQTPDYSVPPVDALDALFRAHDIADQASDPAERAQGDLALLQGIETLPEGTLSPEGHLYAGGASVAMLGSIAIRHGQPELLSPNEVFVFGHGAFENLANGGLEPDALEVAALQARLDDLEAISGLDMDSVVDTLVFNVPSIPVWANDLW